MFSMIWIWKASWVNIFTMIMLSFANNIFFKYNNRIRVNLSKNCSISTFDSTQLNIFKKIPRSAKPKLRLCWLAELAPHSCKNLSLVPEAQFMVPMWFLKKSGKFCQKPISKWSNSVYQAQPKPQLKWGWAGFILSWSNHPRKSFFSALE